MFPFFFPDCRLLKKNGGCGEVGGDHQAPVEYRGCTDENGRDGDWWCSTRTYRNRSLITGEWGFCSQGCARETVRSDQLSSPTMKIFQTAFSLFQS